MILPRSRKLVVRGGVKDHRPVLVNGGLQRSGGGNVTETLTAAGSDVTEGNGIDLLRSPPVPA
jgi:hypothetical protein